MNSTTYSDPIMQKFRDLAAETVFAPCGPARGWI